MYIFISNVQLVLNDKVSYNKVPITIFSSWSRVRNESVDKDFNSRELRQVLSVLVIFSDGVPRMCWSPGITIMNDHVIVWQDDDRITRCWQDDNTTLSLTPVPLERLLQHDLLRAL